MIPAAGPAELRLSTEVLLTMVVLRVPASAMPDPRQWMMLLTMVVLVTFQYWLGGSASPRMMPWSGPAVGGDAAKRFWRMVSWSDPSDWMPSSWPPVTWGA